ncbi:hemolysin [Leucobacter sp. OLJS4]|uniref:hemolysin family protein n=1 Tax=unclassified Leucobacter TaxID=2621730 RepID=UPI000C19DE5E|nr:MULTISPECIES: hemolysin family protein [unclassified Leucobacter]PII81634.1 hemolysin [Leucobacter sp. OLCALW19]PII86305.1 hemolysin [Leucobacter sp. OLTLW20]PII90200.1 hemolysin [Leucobacter sp. OLAS13]PII96617.1 hemolysin [Leucobacter sp. OLCS4]PII97233.1 hemolysin [Leucobacter sp. OLDS2]
MTGGLIALFLAAAVVLLAIGGLLAASDAALSVRSKAELLALSEDARRGASIRAIAEDEAAHQNALGFARVAAETLAAVLITLVLAALIEPLWLTLLAAALIMTAVTFVLVGTSPRTVGTHHPEGIIRFSAPLVHGIRVLLGPIASSLMRVGDRVTPGRGGSSALIRDEQQLLSMVDQAAEQELLEADDRDYIHSLVEFGETRVRELMVPRIDMVTVDAGLSMKDALEAILASRHSRVPVVTDDVDDVVGVAHLRDASGFVLRRPEEAESAPITRVMKPALFVPELQPADELLRQMQRESVHLALAVDEYGGISGLVTLEDLIEELLGDISDEHDRETPEIVLDGDGFIVSARLTIDRLGELFERELEDDEVDTVGGLLAKHLGRLAEPGDRVEIDGIELTALETERRRQRLVTARVRWVGTEDNDADQVRREEEQQ